MNTYWISLPCDLLSSLASFQCSLLHHLHLSSDLGLSKYVNQHSHLNLSRNVRLSVLYNLDFNKVDILLPSHMEGFVITGVLKPFSLTWRVDGVASTIIGILDRIFDIWQTSGCIMVDVPYLAHLWDGQKDCLDVGQVRCFHEEASRKTTFWKGDTKESDRVPTKKSLV